MKMIEIERAEEREGGVTMQSASEKQDHILRVSFNPVVLILAAHYNLLESFRKKNPCPGPNPHQLNESL